jgi:cyclophilin family peptidyl-prolyl cis-trans isomerase
MSTFSLPTQSRRTRISVVQLSAALALAALLMIGAPAARAANPRVVMTIAERGSITIELYQKDAPKTVAHFLKLVNEKFYDGLLFHRVVPSFVVQAGDPKSLTIDGKLLRNISPEAVAQQFGLGNGGSDENIPFEKTPYTHEHGTLAMALNKPQSATGDSQFFINLKANTQLNGDYCVFGKVVKGLDVVDKIQQGDRISSVHVVAESSAPAKPAKGKKKS